MRKSYVGLAALVRNALPGDPLGGEVFVFVNRRPTQMKCLYFDGDGYCLWSKRLAGGRFQVCWGGASKQVLGYSAWRCIVEGIDLNLVRHLKRYRHGAGDRPQIFAAVPRAPMSSAASHADQGARIAELEARNAELTRQLEWGYKKNKRPFPQRSTDHSPVMKGHTRCRHYEIQPHSGPIIEKYTLTATTFRSIHAGGPTAALPCPVW